MKIFLFIIILIYVNNENINLFTLFIKSSVLSNNEYFIIMCGILPIKIYDNLTNTENFRSDLHKVGGVYGIVNISDPKKIRQYIGSSQDLYHRLLDHLNGRDSNTRLQRSIAKYGIENFKIYIYYFHLDPNVILTVPEALKHKL